MPPIPSDLLALYLAGEADAAQRRAVEEWAAASPENSREWQRMRTLWEMGDAALAVPDVDVDAAWSRMELRMGTRGGSGRVIPLHRGPRLMRWLAAAAVLAGLVFAAQWFLRTPVETFAALEDPVQVVLADSSRTVLNPGSQMHVKMGRRREVRLQGTAYFEVTRDEQRPFVVKAGELQVTVLGTAFEVSAEDTAAYALVRVRSGRVRVVVQDDTLELSAGQHARYDRRRNELERSPAPPAEVWGLRVLAFERAKLSEVVAQLERIYRVRIEVHNEAINQCLLTTEFDDDTIDHILQVIADTFGLQVNAIGPAHYEMDGEGC